MDFDFLCIALLIVVLTSMETLWTSGRNQTVMGAVYEVVSFDCMYIAMISDDDNMLGHENPTF